MINLVEIITLVAFIAGGIFAVRAVKSHRKEIREGKKRKLLIDSREKKRCPVCDKICYPAHEEVIYDGDTKSWYHDECYKSFFHGE